MKWRIRAASAWERCWQAFPACAGPDCAPSRRLWRHLRSFPGIGLHDSWYCSPSCFEEALRRHLESARPAGFSQQTFQHRLPLGLLLLSRGQLTDSQLRRALDHQRQQGTGRLGQWLETLGFATEAQITAALGLQWACPVLPRFAAGERDCTAMVPFPLLDTFRMLPVQFVGQTRTLHVAFSQGVEYAALLAIEQVLRCRTEPCLLARSQMESALEQIGLDRRPGEVLFEGCRDAAEMARITCGYAMQLEGGWTRLSACGDYIWVRLERAPEVADLLFWRGAKPRAGADAFSSRVIVEPGNQAKTARTSG